MREKITGFCAMIAGGLLILAAPPGCLYLTLAGIGLLLVLVGYMTAFEEELLQDRRGKDGS